MRASFPTMGTVVSISLDRALPARVIDEVKDVFESYDQVFSLYRVQSPLSAMARGDLRLAEAPDPVRAEYMRALSWRSRTHGWFTPHRPDGVIDLAGTVKAAAIQAAGAVLSARGAEGLIGAGGDILALGSSSQRVGIVDPADRTVLLADVVLASRRAIATSGAAERGDHIWSQLGATDILQATLLADDIIAADVLATAVVAAGTGHLDDVLECADVDALIVTRDGLLATPGGPRPQDGIRLTA